jgi:hypothetical protein
MPMIIDSIVQPIGLLSVNNIEQNCKYLQTDTYIKALINISKPNLSN